jgi:hypothetical protein
MRIDHLRICRLSDDLLRACSRKSGHLCILLRLISEDLHHEERSLEDLSFERRSLEGLLQEKQLISEDLNHEDRSVEDLSFERRFLEACSRKSGHLRIHLVEADLLRICTMRKPRSLEDLSFERRSLEGLLQEERSLEDPSC